MRLSTKVRYGMRAMIELARQAGDKPVMIRTIAEKQGLSDKYLEQLFTHLRTAGLVKSERGARGGYRLARSADKITALDIYLALGGAAELIECAGHPETCERHHDCPTIGLWRELGAAMRCILAGKTLKELAATAQNDTMWYI